jgi:excisionase family DNA binding protein
MAVGMTITEAAEYIGLAYSTLAQAAREGRIDAWRSGGTWLTTVEALEEAIEAGRIRPRNTRKENEMSRVAQINWLNELADNIAQNIGEGTAEELVEYALSDEGRESWGIDVPEWFDGHDRDLLIESVADNL